MKYAIIFAILVLGCLTPEAGPVTPAQPLVTYGHGLRITSFEASFDEIYSKDRFKINIEVLNVGNADAIDAEAELYRYGPFEISDRTYNFSSPLDKPVYGETTNQPGGSDSGSWDVTAPATSSNYPFTFGVKVAYNYETVGKNAFQIYTRELLREGEVSFPYASETSAAPVSADITVPSKVVLNEEDGTFSRSFPIKVSIRNGGTGIVKTRESDACGGRKVGCIDYVDIRMQNTTRVSGTCSGGDSETSPVQVADEPFYSYYLEDISMIGDIAYISCDFDAYFEEEPQVPVNFFIVATAGYGYQVESDLNVVVLGGGS